MRGYLDIAAQRGTHLALFPEQFNTFGLPPGVPLGEAAELLTGETVREARRLAGECAMAVVLPIDGIEDGRIWNCAVVVDYRGEIAGVYRKVHPTRAELAAGRSAGCDFPVFHVAVGPETTLRVGVMICHDNSFVESARCLALAGAELICWPHVQTGWGDVVWDITLRSRAIDNGVWVMSSCYAVRGDQAWRPGMMVGRSGIVGPDGFILGEFGRDAGVATVEVDFDSPRLVHSWTESEDRPFVEELRRDRRPDAYGRITELPPGGEP
jgi:predicted amidohydrolase